MEDKELQRLQARVANLEVALHGLWATLKELQPPHTQDMLDDMMWQHFQAMEDMDAVKSGLPTFERA